ncbi:MAG TPA: YceD family protein [Casimicrobiaceae bacterium]|nr:YceD family protein [Casimicrobiaceae bacterium]
MRRDTGGQAPARFDALELAETGGTITGVVDPTGLSRLADRLAPPDRASRAQIAWRITGGRDSLGRAMLTLSLDGTVLVVCQRCLRPFAVPVEQETMLLLARDEAELRVLDAAEPEVILAKAPVDPVALVEDELLLSLPFSPRHNEAECGSAGAAHAGPEAAQTPFAALARLKAGQGSSN